MSKWDSQTLLGGSGVGVADLMLISDQSQAEGSQDRNITVGEASLAGHQFLVSQASHGLSVGDCVRWNGSAYVEAVATTGANALFNGVIVQVIDTNSYVIKHDGFAYGFSGLTPGSKYYLQDSGGLGTSPGTVDVPVVLAVTSTSGWLLSTAGSAGVSYEEGTFSPYLRFPTIDPTWTNVVSDGVYVKINNKVFCQMHFQGSYTGTASGELRVLGLPFVVGDYLPNTTIQAGSICHFVSNLSAAGDSPVSLTAIGGTTYVSIRRQVSGGTQTITNVNTTTGVIYSFRANLAYQV